jgi:drug/metabolite transporter (DMT)-like permease
MPKDKIYAYAGLIMAVFFWATNTVIARGVVQDVNPMALSFWRWVVAFMVILPFSVKSLSKDAHEIKTNKFRLAILSFFSVTVYNSLLYTAAHYTTALNMSIAAAAFPTITIVIAWLVIHEIPSGSQLVGVVISAVGMLSLIVQGSFENLYNLKFNYGDLMVVGAVISWSIYSVYLRRYKIHIEPISFLTMTIILGSIFIMPFYAWEILETRTFSVNLRVFPIILFVGIFPSILSYFWWNNGIAKVGPGISSMFYYLLPLFAAILACIFLGEQIKVFHVLGGTLIFSGLYLAIKRRRN